MNPNPLKKMSPEEFLEFERASDEKHEYYDGVIVAMSGARRAHNLISLNIGSSLHGFVKDKDCETYMSEMRVFVPKTRLYAYPDVVVVCGEPKFQDDTFDTLINPVLLIEILSETTEGYDRGLKFQNYRSIESLREYVLVSQDQRRIEKYVRHGDGFWMMSEAVVGSISLESIGFDLPLEDVYTKVKFVDSKA